MQRGKQIRPPYQIYICIGPVRFYFLDDVFDADHQSADLILQSKTPLLPFFCRRRVRAIQLKTKGDADLANRAPPC
jgi:hypothetical protein